MEQWQMMKRLANATPSTAHRPLRTQLAALDYRAHWKGLSTARNDRQNALLKCFPVLNRLLAVCLLAT